MTSLDQQLKTFQAKYEKRLRATTRSSIQEVVSRAQLPRGQGGLMRIDTGFLRASIQAALGTLPSGPTRGQKGVSYPNPLPAAGEAVAATLLRWDPMTEVPFFVGWTANYARIREVRDGFLRTATGKWDIIVKTETQKVRSAI